MRENSLMIRVENVKKQYRLGQMGGGTLRGDLQSWWARVRGKEDPNTLIGTDQRLIGTTFMALNGVDLTVYQGEALGIIGRNGAGKSTLMNLISKSEVFAENKLFATLDTTVRKVVFDNLPFLLSDTVGFIRKLPTELIESFKSTLDEVREADLLLHIVDISHPDFEEQIEVVNKTLADIGASGKPMILVFNKIDAYTYVEKAPDDLTPRTKENLTLEELMKTWMAKLEDNCLFISARERINVEELKSVVYRRVKELHVQKYPYNDFLYQTYDEEEV